MYLIPKGLSVYKPDGWPIRKQEHGTIEHIASLPHKRIFLQRFHTTTYTYKLLANAVSVNTCNRDVCIYRHIDAGNTSM